MTTSTLTYEVTLDTNDYYRILWDDEQQIVAFNREDLIINVLPGANLFEIGTELTMTTLDWRKNNNLSPVSRTDLIMKILGLVATNPPVAIPGTPNPVDSTYQPITTTANMRFYNNTGEDGPLIGSAFLDVTWVQYGPMIIMSVPQLVASSVFEEGDTQYYRYIASGSETPMPAHVRPASEMRFRRVAIVGNTNGTGSVIIKPDGGIIFEIDKPGYPGKGLTLGWVQFDIAYGRA